MAGANAWPALLLNDERLAILPSASFTALAVAPGFYRVSMERDKGYSFRWPATTQIEAAAGKRYFILLEVVSESTRELAFTGVDSMPLFPRSGLAIKDMRWIHLDEPEGISQARHLLYVPPLPPAR
jgi:hypothetical protein